MAAASVDIIRLRRMVAESGNANGYTDGVLSAAIERYPVRDADGYAPTDTLWTDTYDLNRAAADIWTEKAAAVSVNFDFAADGGDYKRSQAYAQMMRMAAQFRSMRQTTTLVLVADPPPASAVRADSWIGNLAELD